MIRSIFFFFGGEPLLEFGLIVDICEWIWNGKWKNKYILEISTNGTLFHGNICKWFKENSKKISVILSADGDEITQNKNRDNSFSKIDFKAFLNIWDHAAVKMTISRECIENLAGDVIFFHEKGFYFTECNLAEGVIWTEKEKKVFDRELSKLSQYYAEHPEVIPAPIVNLQLWKCLLKREKELRCGIGNNLFVYDCDGKKQICNYFTDMTFSDEQLTQVLDHFQKGTNVVDTICMDGCFYYPICRQCYGADYLINGKFGKRNVSRCKMVECQAYYSAIIRGNRIRNLDLQNLEPDELLKLQYEITAIKTILSKGGEKSGKQIIKGVRAN